MIYIWGCPYRSLEITVKLDGVEISDGIVDIIYESLDSADEVWEVKAEGRVDWTSEDGNGVERHGTFHFGRRIEKKDFN